MRQTCIFLLLIAFSSIASAQNRMLDKYADMEGVESVYISKAMFEYISADDDLDISGDIEIGKIISDIDCLQLISTENPRMIEKISRELVFDSSNGYSELMRIKDDDERTFVYQKKIKKDINEYILYITECKRNGSIEELVVISLTGRLTPRDIQRAIAD